MMIKGEPNVQYEQVEPEVIWMTIDGVHFPLTGPLALFYRWFAVLDCEEAAKRELHPWIMGARRVWMEKVKAAASPQKTAAQIAQ